jgi:cell division septal protein FtsQ
MTDYDRKVREKLQKLESIESRLTQHAKTTRLGLIWLTVLALTLLVLLGYQIVHL